MPGRALATSLNPLNHTFSFRIGVAFASFATPQKCLDSVWFWYVELALFWWFAFCFLLLAACLFLLACRVFGFCLDGKLQGFWHSFTALHPCTWFVQPKCLIKRELSTLTRSFLYLPLSHSLSLSHSVSMRAWEWLRAKSKIFDFLDDEIANPAMQMDSQVRFVCHASWFS